MGRGIGAPALSWVNCHRLPSSHRLSPGPCHGFLVGLLSSVLPHSVPSPLCHQTKFPETHPIRPLPGVPPPNSLRLLPGTWKKGCSGVSRPCSHHPPLQPHSLCKAPLRNVSRFRPRPVAGAVYLLSAPLSGLCGCGLQIHLTTQERGEGSLWGRGYVLLIPVSLLPSQGPAQGRGSINAS